MIPYAIMEIMENRKTDTATAMSVMAKTFINSAQFAAEKTTSEDDVVVLELCAQLTEGASEDASLQAKLDFVGTSLYIVNTSVKICIILS
jgi:hypothetical protein